MHNLGFTLDPSPIFYLALFLLIVFIYTGYMLALRKRKPFAIHVFTLLFTLYFLGVLKFTFTPLVLFTEYPVPFTIQKFYNIIPLKTIITTIGREYWMQIFGNIVLLLPIPIFMKLIWKNINSKIIFLFSLGTVLFIEASQFILDFITDYPNKVADIDDVILNMLGVAIGWVLAMFLHKTTEEASPQTDETHRNQKIKDFMGFEQERYGIMQKNLD